jgi:glyoxylase I family protein
MPAPLPWTSLNHIALMTKRVEECTAFYERVLGFRRVQRPNFDFRGAWLLKDGVCLHLLENPKAGDPSEVIQTREHHHALHTEDIRAVEESLIAHDVPYRRNWMANTDVEQLFFQDPDGNVWEIAKHRPFLELE